MIIRHITGSYITYIQNYGNSKFHQLRYSLFTNATKMVCHKLWKQGEEHIALYPIFERYTAVCFSQSSFVCLTTNHFFYNFIYNSAKFIPSKLDITLRHDQDLTPKYKIQTCLTFQLVEFIAFIFTFQEVSFVGGKISTGKGYELQQQVNILNLTITVLLFWFCFLFFLQVYFFSDIMLLAL